MKARVDRLDSPGVTLLISVAGALTLALTAVILLFVWPEPAARIIVAAVACAALIAWLRFTVMRAHRDSRRREPTRLDNDEAFERADEISREFDELVQDYVDHRDQLEERSSQLKQAVRRRTADLVRSNRQLKKIDRLKDEFVSLLAHELRTPLTSVRSYVELLFGYGDDIEPADREEFLGIIRHQVQRLSRLIDELLDLSHLRSGRFQLDLGDCSLSEAVTEVMNCLAPQIGAKNHEVVDFISDDEEQPTVRCDPDRLVQILTNLIGNAIKYGPEGTRIELHSESTDNGTRRIVVSDDGPGIPSDERDLIFEPFYRTRSVGQSSVEGTGLGLYLSRELARQMGGNLICETPDEGGARFVLRIPEARAPGAVEETADRDGTDQAEQAGQAKRDEQTTADDDVAELTHARADGEPPHHD